MSKRCLPIAAAILLATTFANSDEPLARLNVSAGVTARSNTPVSVDLRDRIDAGKSLRLTEVTGDERVDVPCQVEAKTEPARLWWILAGRTKAGATRRFELRYGSPDKSATPVSIAKNQNSIDVNFGTQKIFTYNHGDVVPPKGIGKEFTRSGYITPLFSPGGKLISEDFPPDHHHHKGIWFPWTDTVFDGKKIDFWNLGKKQGTVRHAGYEVVEAGPVFAHIRVKHEFVDLTQNQENGGKVALDETWNVRVFAVGAPDDVSWLWDMTSTQHCASASPLHLEKYRYGGLAYRGPKEWKGDNYEVLASTGRTKANGHATRAKWCAHSGSIDGAWTTVLAMCSPKNDRFPENMRIWPKGGAFFNWAPVQAGPWTLVPGKDYVFRYRFFVHEGKIDADRAEARWQDFGAPPVVSIE